MYIYLYSYIYIYIYIHLLFIYEYTYIPLLTCALPSGCLQPPSTGTGALAAAEMPKELRALVDIGLLGADEAHMVIGYNIRYTVTQHNIT